MYCTVQVPGYWCVPACLNGCMCVRAIMYVHTAACVSCWKRKCSRWPLILVAFSSLLWSKKLKVQAWGPSRQPVKDVQIYKHVGSRDTFRWRVNMLWLCLYNNCAAVRGRRCLIPGWLGIIWRCTVQAATLHYWSKWSVFMLPLFWKGSDTIHWAKKWPSKCALNTWIIIKCICIFGEVSNCKVSLMKEKVKELHFCSSNGCFLNFVAC